LLFALCALLIADAGVGVGFAAPPGPPALEVFVQGPVTQYAVAVLLPEIFDGNYNITHTLFNRFY